METDRGLSVETDRESTCSRKESSDSEGRDNWAFKAKRARIYTLEQSMDVMFSNIMERNYSLAPGKEDPIVSQSQSADSRLGSPDEWRPPSCDLGIGPAQQNLSDIEFLPDVKKAEVVKRLHASPVFTTLKMNAELGDLGVQSSVLLTKQEGILATITHGLLLQRKSLAKELKRLAAKYPAAAEDLRKLLSEGSSFKEISDDLLQYVCELRAETIELRRKAFKTKNHSLTAMLQQIPPSSTHLFQEDRLSNFIKDNGGVSRIFPSSFGRNSEREKPTVQHRKSLHQTFNQKRKQSGGKAKNQRQQRRKYEQEF